MQAEMLGIDSMGSQILLKKVGSVFFVLHLDSSIYKIIGKGLVLDNGYTGEDEIHLGR